VKSHYAITNFDIQPLTAVSLDTMRKASFAWHKFLDQSRNYPLISSNLFHCHQTFCCQAWKLDPQPYLWLRKLCFSRAARDFVFQIIIDGNGCSILISLQCHNTLNNLMTTKHLIEVKTNTLPFPRYILMYLRHTSNIPLSCVNSPPSLLQIYHSSNQISISTMT
jgi:hypothetical protein